MAREHNGNKCITMRWNDRQRKIVAHLANDMSFRLAQAPINLWAWDNFQNHSTKKQALQSPMLWKNLHNRSIACYKFQGYQEPEGFRKSHVVMDWWCCFGSKNKLNNSIKGLKLMKVRDWLASQVQIVELTLFHFLNFFLSGDWLFFCYMIVIPVNLRFRVLPRFIIHDYLVAQNVL